MKNVKLYIPEINDLWFRQECMSDSVTMSYNAGYDVSYEGYHYDTGCIDFPKAKWERWFTSKLKSGDLFYAYILDTKTEQFVGYVNFKKNSETKKASMGIVINSKFQGMGFMRPSLLALIDEAKRNGVKALTDTVPSTREKALKVFFDLGFKTVGQFTHKKFGKDEVVLEIEKEL